MANKAINLRDSEYIRFYYANDEFICLIHEDGCAKNPREETSCFTHMVCWNTTLGLGDQHDFKNEKDFLEKMSEECGISGCQPRKTRVNLIMQSGKVVMLPVYSVGSSDTNLTTADHGDVFDCKQIGWIYTRREEFINATQCSEDLWECKASQFLRKEVITYKQYLRGEVYWCKIFRHCASCGGFYGTDIAKNGIIDYVDGLAEAIDD